MYFYPSKTELVRYILVSVHHKSEFCQNGWMDWAGFWHRDYHRLILQCVKREFGSLLVRIRVTSFRNFIWSCGLWKISSWHVERRVVNFIWLTTITTECPRLVWRSTVILSWDLSLLNWGENSCVVCCSRSTGVSRRRSLCSGRVREHWNGRFQPYEALSIRTCWISGRRQRQHARRSCHIFD